MSRGSRVGCGREIGPRCRGPKSPANVELLQALMDRLGQPGGPSAFSLRCPAIEPRRLELWKACCTTLLPVVRRSVVIMKLPFAGCGRSSRSSDHVQKLARPVAAAR
jgi:hypothetical protein